MLNENEKQFESRCTTYCLPGVRHVTLNFWTGTEGDAVRLSHPSFQYKTLGHPDFEDGTLIEVKCIDQAEAPSEEGHPGYLLTFEPVGS